MKKRYFMLMMAAPFFTLNGAEVKTSRPNRATKSPQPPQPFRATSENNERTHRRGRLQIPETREAFKAQVLKTREIMKAHPQMTIDIFTSSGPYLQRTYAQNAQTAESFAWLQQVATTEPLIFNQTAATLFAQRVVGPTFGKTKKYEVALGQFLPKDRQQPLLRPTDEHLVNSMRANRNSTAQITSIYTKIRSNSPLLSTPTACQLDYAKIQDPNTFYRHAATVLAEELIPN